MIMTVEIINRVWNIACVVIEPVNSLKIKFEVYEIPGHTLDHIAFKSQNNLFCGDTIFSSGCGRVFEGTHLQMYNSSSNQECVHQDNKKKSQ